MPGIYAAADLLVLPSENETWGLVANEALACGRPIVVANTVGCSPDLAADGTAGRVFQAGNIRSLADALVNIMDDMPNLSDIAAKSRDYSVSAAADGVIRALSQVKKYPV
jgi:glycosyltransferase involved in cell wall biosynthesis